MAKKSSFSSIKKSPAAKVSLTSLMDALTIILIFLLTNYSDNPQEVDLPSFIKLPQVTGQDASQNEKAVPVSISLNKIQIGKKAEAFYVEFKDYKTELDRIVIEYKNHLSEIKKITEEKNLRDLASSGGSAGSEPPKIRLAVMADQGVPYDFIDSLMFASNEVGLNFFDFMLKKIPE